MQMTQLGCVSYWKSLKTLLWDLNNMLFPLLLPSQGGTNKVALFPPLYGHNKRWQINALHSRHYTD